MADTMEENIPIESESRKKFEKTVKGIKKMLKKGTIKPAEQADVVESNVDKKEKKTFSKRQKGVVYIGHIPHGFYEEQMQSYFSQFGKVTNVKVSRSPKTGKSKGYGFVEFLDKDVAQIVAQTMNNYLMDKRLLKAEYIPPERQRLHFFKGRKWVPGKTNPAVFKRQKDVRQKNKQVTDEEWLKEAKKRIKRLHKLKIALKSAGVDYDFFQPTDVPAELADFDPEHPEKHNLNKKQSEEKKSNKTDEKQSNENIVSEKNKQKKIEKKSKNETELKKKVVEIKQKKSVEKTPQKNVKTPKKEKMTSPKVLALQTKTIEKKTKGISHNLINKKNKNKK